MGITGSLDLRTKDASLLHRALTRRPKWKIPAEKRDDILRAGYEALQWARENEDANAIARIMAVFRAMEADNTREELKREEWDRLDAGKVSARTETTGQDINVAVALMQDASLAPLIERMAAIEREKALSSKPDA